TRAAKMGLHTAVLMKHIVVFLARTVVAGEMNKPIPPTIRIVNRERTDIARAISKRLEDESLCSPQPLFVAHAAFERGKIGCRHAKKFELGGEKVRISLAQKG